MGYYDFPHTRNYDQDLGFLIKQYYKLDKDYDELDKKYTLLVDIYDKIKNNIIDITIEQLQTWLDAGVFDRILEKLNKKLEFNKIVSKKVYGQAILRKVLPNDYMNYSAQGFTIHDNIAMFAFINDDRSKNGILISYDLKTNSVYNSNFTVYLQHANSITYNDIEKCFVVTGGTSELDDFINIYKFNERCELLSITPFYDEYKFGAITFQNGYYFIKKTNKINSRDVKLAKYDLNFNLIYEKNIELGYTQQSIFSDNNFIYVIYGSTSGDYFNSINVYNIDSFEFYQTLNIDINKEVEDGVIIDDVCYLSTNNNNSSYVYICDIYNNEKNSNTAYHSILNSINNNPAISSASPTIYNIDSNYTDFLVDNTQNLPYSDFINAYLDGIETRVSKLTFNIRNDIYYTGKSIILQSSNKEIVINFDNTTLNKYMYIRNCHDVTINNGNFIGNSDYCFYIISSFVRINNAIFNGTFTRLINAVNNSKCVVNNCDIVKSGSNIDCYSDLTSKIILSNYTGDVRTRNSFATLPFTINENYINTSHLTIQYNDCGIWFKGQFNILNNPTTNDSLITFNNVKLISVANTYVTDIYIPVLNFNGDSTVLQLDVANNRIIPKGNIVKEINNLVVNIFIPMQVINNN